METKCNKLIHNIKSWWMDMLNSLKCVLEKITFCWWNGNWFNYYGIRNKQFGLFMSFSNDVWLGFLIAYVDCYAFFHWSCPILWCFCVIQLLQFFYIRWVCFKCIMTKLLGSAKMPPSISMGWWNALMIPSP